MRRRFPILQLAGILVASLLTGFTAPTMARADTLNLNSLIAFDIPSQPLETALLQLSKQAACQLAISAATLPTGSAPSVNGTMSIRSAVEKLLANTDLSYKLLGDRTLTILPNGRNSANNSDAAGTPHVMRVAGDFRPAQLRLAAAAAADTSAQAQTPSPAETQGAEKSGTSEMVITGSRLKTTGKAPAPVITFDQEKIKELGVSQVANLLDYLPQQSFTVVEGLSTFGGAHPVQLRGLGLGTTLVLINGRRTVTSALQGARAFFDLNMLPLSAVERVEVLSDSASSVYGADAIGGVLNIILKDHIDKPTLDAYYGATQGGGETTQASFAFSPTSGRFRSNVVLEYSKRDVMYAKERPEFFVNTDFRRFGVGGTNQLSQQRNPGNVCSTNGANLPGLSAPCAGVPQGSTGVGLTPASFQATAGVLNYGGTYDYFSLIAPLERKSGSAFGEFDLVPGITAFVEALYAERDDERNFAPARLTNVQVPANNPFNPFGVPVLINYRFDVDTVGVTRELAHTDSFRAVSGLRGDRGGWNWETSLLYTSEQATNIQLNSFNVAKATAALAQTNPALALNPFQDGPGGSADLLRSLLTDVPPADSYMSSAVQASGSVQHDLFTLPAGAVQALVGAEARKESISFNSNGSIIFMDENRESTAAFFELRVPVIGGPMQTQQQLTLIASGRYDDYDDIGSTFNPQLGAVWTFTPSFMVRGSYGKGFRAPSLFELYQPLVTRTTPITDSARGETVDVQWTTGGDTSLQPEKSTSYSAGFVFSPQSLPGLELSASYWSVKQDKRVVRTSTTSILQNESYFPERVTRAARTPADITANVPGRLLALRATNLNAGSLDTSGIDLELNYSVKTAYGRFTPSLSATWVNTFTAADFPTTPIFDRVDLAQSSGTIPGLRAVASLGWSRAATSVSTTLRYVAPYDDANATAVRNGRTISPPIITDLQASLDIGELGGVASGWRKGLVFRVGAFNLFDEMPSFSEAGSVFGYDYSQGDLRGRFLYTQLTKSF